MAAVLFCFVAGAEGDAEVPAQWVGKSGPALRRALGATHRPAALPGPGVIGGRVYDHFGGRYVEAGPEGLPEPYSWGCIVPAQWWDLSGGVYGDTVAADLINLIPLSPETILHRGDLPPGSVERADYDNGIWFAGSAWVSGLETRRYDPPVSLRGRLARTLFYAAAVYPAGAWTARGGMVFDGSTYPAFWDSMADMLMGWHRAEAPTEEEKGVNDLARRHQGNGNPFVEHPDLAEYLWGTRRGEPYLPEGEPEPLRGRYSMADPLIRLFSPEVAGDAVWSVDGRTVEGNTLRPRDLGAGEHTLTYRSPSTGERGTIMIIIEP